MKATHEPKGMTPSGASPPEVELWRDFEHSRLEMERRMDRFVREAFSHDKPWDFPVLQGLALQRGPEGDVKIQTFGNLQESLDRFLEGWREPLLTYNVSEQGDTIEFRAEVPGIRKGDLKVDVQPDTLNISAESKGAKYRARCSPGYVLDPKSAEARYEDGVLVVTSKLIATPTDGGRRLIVK